jgi:LuxR family maltose regulon positive regulatory protein
VLVAGDAAGQALGLLEHLHALAVAQRRTGSAIEVRAVQALALAAAGDETAALAALTDAVVLAAPEGHLRVFADEGPPMAALVGRLVTARRREPAAPGGAAAGYLGRLVRAFEPQGPAGERPGRPGTVAVPGLVEPLSARELEVLGYLAAGTSNQQIADELVVALATVKKHVSHVLDKLGAANRTQAVTRARELGLLR